MGGKVKKALSSATKVATFGLVKDPSQALNTLTGGAATLLTGNVNAAADQYAKQQAAVERQQATIRENAAALSASNVADNTANVVAGGTAGMVDDATSDLKRKGRASLSSVLGIS